MKASRIKSVDYFKEFVDTQHKVGVFVELFYIRNNDSVLVYTNGKFRIATTLHIKELEGFLKDYPHKRRNIDKMVYITLKEVN